MEVEKLTAMPVFGNRGHQPDLVTDPRLVGEPRQKMRRIFEQKRHTITAVNCSGPRTHEMHDLGGSGQWQRDAGAERPLIVSGNCLISEMLTVPVKRPNRLEAVQHVEVGVVPRKSRADGQLDAMHDDRELATDRVYSLELVGNDVHRQHFTVSPRPTKHLRCYLDKIDQPWPLEVGR